MACTMACTERSLADILCMMLYSIFSIVQPIFILQVPPVHTHPCRIRPGPSNARTFTSKLLEVYGQDIYMYTHIYYFYTLYLINIGTPPYRNSLFTLPSLVAVRKHKNCCHKFYTYITAKPSYSIFFLKGGRNGDEVRGNQK